MATDHAATSPYAVASCAITGSGRRREGQDHSEPNPATEAFSFAGPPSRIDLFEDEVGSGERRHRRPRLNRHIVTPLTTNSRGSSPYRKTRIFQAQPRACPAWSACCQATSSPMTEPPRVEHLDHPARPGVDKDGDRRRPSFLTGAQQADAKRLIGTRRQEGENRLGPGTRPAPMRRRRRSSSGSGPAIGSTRTPLALPRRSRAGSTRSTALRTVSGKAR